MQKKTDIIIPIHNRWEHTKQTLDSLIANTDPQLFNLYVCDDLSDPGNIDLLRRYHAAARLGFDFSVFYQKENIGPAATRNGACSYITRRKLRAHYLYHSDNDVFFKSNWLTVLTRSYENLDYLTSGKVKLLGGGCHPYLQDKESVLVLDSFRVGIKDAVSGYSQLMTWETWDKYGPFDEGGRGQEIKIMGSEDWAFCQRIIKDGGRVGSLYPEQVIATGKTNTYGLPATGSETFKQMEGVIIK